MTDESGVTRKTRREPCPGSGRRVSDTQSSAFPEVKCPCCDAYLRPVLDDKALRRYRMRSHRPVHNKPDDTPDLTDGVVDAMASVAGVMEAQAAALEQQAGVLREQAAWLRRALEDPSIPPVTGRRA
jgi:hypothetical protein